MIFEAPEIGKQIAENRLQSHLRFITERAGSRPEHHNYEYGFPVVTKQEQSLVLYNVSEIERTAAAHYCCTHNRAEISGGHLYL